MALGNDTFSAISGSVNDLFSGLAGLERAAGSAAEAQAYGIAATISREQAEFTKESTAVKTFMADRQIYKAIGREETQIAGAGFEKSGTALDLLRESAQQGSLETQLLQRQGLITQESYEQQAKSYDFMKSAAEHAADAGVLGSIGSFVNSAVKGAFVVASLAA